MIERRKKPQKSLRTILVLWFLVFATVPLAFLTGYSIVKFEQAINRELAHRLEGNFREINIILSDLYSELSSRVNSHAKDKSLIYYMSNASHSQARSLAKRWMQNHFARQMRLFGVQGRLEVSLSRKSNGSIERQAKYESTDVYLSKDFLKKLGENPSMSLVDTKKDTIDLVIFSKILSPRGKIVGYIEEAVRLDQSFVDNLQKRLNVQLGFFGGKKGKIIATHENLKASKAPFFLRQLADGGTGFFDLTMQQDLHGFLVRPVKWGGKKLYSIVGASKKELQRLLKDVQTAFFFVAGAVILLLIVLSLVISRLLLRPLSQLVDAIQNVDPDKGLVEVKSNSDNELGLLVDTFNDMSARIYQAQNQLKGNIDELEQANQQIKDAQSKLVHTAKMASLGQLVAGVAHELNNPIGFIYSNMGHLREYSEKLINLVGVAEKSPDKLDEAKGDAEFDYIVDDMPKLIQSCEDGARRTRDIVVGLRNFSRLEEAKIKEVDIHESIDNTLDLLRGELKNRITIEKDYGKLPLVTCFPSQLNQVFMNILSNASQAIDGKGKIVISTKKKKDMVEIIFSDDGKGMAPATQEMIFDPFFTTKSLGQGTGLGLSISYGIIQNHGGEIEVKSQVGKGTDFIIQLPIKPR